MDLDCVNSFQMDEDEEIALESLLMKQSMAEAIFQDLATYVHLVDENDGKAPDNQYPPDEWAVRGALCAIEEVTAALHMRLLRAESANNF